MNKTTRFGLMTLMIGFSGLAIGCGSSALPDLDQTQARSSAVQDLSLGVGAPSVTNGGTVQLYPGGGTPPYRFAASGGNVDPLTNIFSATAEGTAQITVYDSLNVQASESILVLPAVKTAPPPTETAAPPPTETAAPPPPVLISANRFSFAAAGLHVTHVVSSIGGGWQLDGEVFKFLRDEVAGSHAIYQCQVPTGSTVGVFSSTDGGCEGQQFIGRMGNLYDAQVAGSVPVYRYSRVNFGVLGQVIDHVDSKSDVPGYTREYVLGYSL